MLALLIAATQLGLPGRPDLVPADWPALPTVYWEHGDKLHFDAACPRIIGQLDPNRQPLPESRRCSCTSLSLAALANHPNAAAMDGLSATLEPGLLADFWAAHSRLTATVNTDPDLAEHDVYRDLAAARSVRIIDVLSQLGQGLAHHQLALEQVDHLPDWLAEPWAQWLQVPGETMRRRLEEFAAFLTDDDLIVLGTRGLALDLQRRGLTTPRRIPRYCWAFLEAPVADLLAISIVANELWPGLVHTDTGRTRIVARMPTAHALSWLSYTGRTAELLTVVPYGENVISPSWRGRSGEVSTLFVSERDFDSIALPDAATALPLWIPGNGAARTIDARTALTLARVITDPAT